jgi:hypothetical protein
MITSQALRSFGARLRPVNGLSLDLAVLEGILVELFGARRRFPPAHRGSFDPRRDLAALASVLFGAQGCPADGAPTGSRTPTQPGGTPWLLGARWCADGEHQARLIPAFSLSGASLKSS